MTDWTQPSVTWQSSPPSPRPKGPDALVLVLAGLIAVLLFTAVAAAAVKSSPSPTKSRVGASASPSPTSTSSSAPPASSTNPSVSTTSPKTVPGTVNPVNPLTVPPVTVPPVTAKKPSLPPTAVAALVNPSVVDVDTQLAYLHATAAGTGMVLTANGVILTNNHVVDGATTIGAVSVGNGRSYPAHVIGVDPTADVALIQLDGASGLHPIATSTAALNPGDPVVAVGNAGGVGGVPSVSSGSVVATGQSIVANDPAGGKAEQLDGLIETTAGLQSGDSGGPLADGFGHVVGIDTAASLATQTTASDPNVSFAIPIATALSIANQILAGQASSTVHLGLPPFLGVSVGAGGRPGALVNAVVAGGPAASVGIAPGALIVSINGSAIDSPDALSTVLRRYRPGDTVTVQWITAAGVTRNARVTLGTGPAD